MTSRMKTIKAPPLLSFPQREGSGEDLRWLDITASDLKVFDGFIGEARRRGIGRWVASYHHFMRKLGTKTQITAEDEGLIRQAYERDSKSHDHSGLLNIVHLMRQLDIPLAPSESDMKLAHEASLSKFS